MAAKSGDVQDAENKVEEGRKRGGLKNAGNEHFRSIIMADI